MRASEIEWDRAETPGAQNETSGARRSSSCLRVITLLLGLGILTSLPLGAQETGTIGGRVANADSDAPLSAVQVYLPGTGTGTLTNDQGRFVLLNVPVGSYELVAERIGFRTLSRTVTVEPGETLSVDFALESAVLGLDEIVVTGTAGAARRREIGNSIAQINTADLPETIMSTEDLLQGRSAGVTVTSTTGQVGGGAAIRLRGNVSAAMSNQPLIYIDGVRMRSEGYPKNRFPIGYPGSSDNTQYSPLNDIAPENIERIEIIKGPAATTLYGTEAAAGVIQIFTKRGRQGAASWTAQITQTASTVQDFGPTEGFDGQPLVVPANEVNPHGSVGKMYMEPWLDTGHNQEYSLSVSGGLERLQYFLSGSFEDQRGVLPNDALEGWNLRGNLTFTPLNDLTLQWNTGYNRSRVQKTPTGGTAEGVTLNAFRRDRNYFNDKDPDAISQVLDFDLRNFVDHFNTGVTATYSPRPDQTNRFTVGYDLAQQETRAIEPFGYFFVPEGRMHDTRWEHRTLTLDYVSSLNSNFGENFSSSFSVGGQVVQDEETSNSAFSQGFPGPGQPTVSSGGTSLGFESRQRVINGGLFVQDVLGYKDRYFVTGGVRFDGNSAFGEDFGIEAYPKVSASYVISDEEFWNLDAALKLRAAWGESGRAPGAFDAVRTWNPDKLGNDVAFFPNNLGNPNLGPERSSELELGFDGTFLGERLNVDFTYYDQTTTDALFAVRQIPSEGGWGSQLRNIGEMTNTGVELSVNGTIFERQTWSWQLGGTLTTNNSETTDLGGASSFSMGNRGDVVEGQPLPVMRGDCVVNPDAFADPIVEEDCDIGPNRPTETVTLNTDLQLPWAGIRISARGEYQGGHYAYSLMDGESITRGIRWPACFNSYPAIDAGDLSQVTARERAMCVATNAQRDFAIFPLDFFRMRNLSVSAPIPMETLGISSARVTLSASNFYTWKEAKESFLDPETSGGFWTDEFTGMNAAVHQVGGSIPIPATYSLALRIIY